MSVDDVFDDILKTDDILSSLDSTEVKQSSRIVNGESISNGRDFIKNEIGLAMNYIEKNGIDSNFVDTFFGGNSVNYKDIFEGKLDSLEVGNLALSNMSRISTLSNFSVVNYSDNDIPFGKLTDLVQNLRTSRWTFLFICASAAVVLAGLWAAAWWFGITIPAAIQTGIISAVSGGVAPGIQIALVCNDPTMNNLDKVASTFGAIVSLGRVFSRILMPILVTAQGALTVASWAFPLVWSVLPVTAWIIASLTYFN